MGLRNGSDEYYEFVEAAERIYHALADAHSITEQRKLAARAHALADRMVEEYGPNDSSVKTIINRYDMRAKY